MLWKRTNDLSDEEEYESEEEDLEGEIKTK